MTDLYVRLDKFSWIGWCSCVGLANEHSRGIMHACFVLRRNYITLIYCKKNKKTRRSAYRPQGRPTSPAMASKSLSLVAFSPYTSQQSFTVNRSATLSHDFSRPMRYKISPLAAQAALWTHHLVSSCPNILWNFVFVQSTTTVFLLVSRWFFLLACYLFT